MIELGLLLNIVAGLTSGLIVTFFWILYLRRQIKKQIEIKFDDLRKECQQFEMENRIFPSIGELNRIMHAELKKDKNK